MIEMTKSPMFVESLLRAMIGKNEQLAQLESSAQENAPKVLFAKSVEECTGTVKVRDLALILRQNGVIVGQNRMFDRLRKDGFLCDTKDDRWNMPTQHAMDMGLFRVNERVIADAYGLPQLARTTLVTGKGQVYLVNYYHQHCKAQQDAKGNGVAKRSHCPTK